MKLSDFKEEVYKCSGCGLCQSVCPVYKILKTECAVSRGKFKLLNAIINKNMNYSKKTLDIMELCLHCQACTEFCPSGIDAQKIIETAQHDMLQFGIFNLPKFIILQLLENRFYMGILKFFLDMVRKTGFIEFLAIFNFTKIKLLSEFFKVKVKSLEVTSNIKKTKKVLYFKGCINNYINPSCENAVKTVLDKTEIEITEADFKCCGLPYKSSGDFESFKKNAEYNLDLIPDDVDYLLFDCASCISSFKSYPDFLDEKYKEKALIIAKKIISIYDLLDKINYEPKANWKKYTLTIHYPCHTRNTKDKKIMAKLVKKIPNSKFVECENSDSCCGAAGSFIFSNPKISQAISTQKAENIIKSKADIVLTSCPACVLGLKQGLINKKSKIQVMNIIEFLAK